MSIESLLFLGIVLLVWMIASVGSWLREQIERYARYQEELEAREAFPPVPDAGSVQPEGVTSEAPECPPPRVVARERLKNSARLRYRNRKTVRRGVILMTVFGPCKALEPRNES